MLIPIGHDQDTVRRLPWVTFSIMGACLLIYLLTLGPVISNQKEMTRELQAIAEYFFQHPETKLPPEMEQLFLGSIPEYQDQRATFKEFLKESTHGMKKDTESAEEQQAHMDALVTAFHETQADSPYFSLGLVPAHQQIFAYLSYQFMHGGFWHLFGNMLFLYLTGPYIEDVWGRPLFAGFYLSAGILSALVYVLKYPDMTGPLVGASGAIAGVMGAFLIRHARVKIRFLFFFFMRPKIISAPAWIMLPLWLGREILFGQATDYAGGQGGGVAHWAHVAGFLYGIIAAVVIQRMNFEENFVEKKLDSSGRVHHNPILEEAMEEMWHGDKGHSRDMLVNYLKSSPGDIDAASALWDISRDIGGLEIAAPFLMTAVREALRKRDTSFVETRWPEIMDALEPGWLDPTVAARVVEVLKSSAPPSLLERTVDAVQYQVNTDTAPGLLLRLARGAARSDAASAGHFAELALLHSDLPAESRGEMEAILQSSPSPPLSPKPKETSPVIPPPTEAAPDASPKVRKIKHELEIMVGKPLSWDSTGRLVLEIAGQKRAIRAQQIVALAVGGINAPGATPFLLMDLMLDGPWSNRRKLRVIRIRSTDFSPLKLFPGDNAMAALRTLVTELLKTSEATPLPDPDSVMGRPFRRFPSLEAFEEEILGQ